MVLDEEVDEGVGEKVEEEMVVTEKETMMSLPTHSDHIITKGKRRECQMSLRQGGLVAGFRI